ncbi:MAG: signal peptidase II [Desulfomonilia bacterium]
MTDGISTKGQERFMNDAHRSRLKTGLLWGLFLSLPCYVFDQWTKWLVNSNLEVGQGFTVLPGFFDIIHTRNTGAAFSLLQGIPESYRLIFFAGVTGVAFVAVVFIFLKVKDASLLIKLTMSLIVAGAIGNLTDRILFNEVVDFLSFHVGRFRWPTFNLADVYITIAMIGLIIHSFGLPTRK